MTGGEPSGDAYVHRRENDGREQGGTCGRCGATINTPLAKPSATGYGLVDLGNGPVKCCYDCCAELDKEWMRKYGRITLYIKTNTWNGYCGHVVTNWPGSLFLPCANAKTGKHNIAGTRLDVWFKFKGYWWWGVHYGECNDLIHCKRTKQKSTTFAGDVAYHKDA